MSRNSLPELTTSRLILRPVAGRDLPLLIELNSDPTVMAFIRGRAATPDETRAEWSERLELRSDATRGLGYWLGFEDDVFVGWWSASFFAPRPSISGVGYRLHRPAWGRGLATEGARAMVEQAFADPDIEKVAASTMAVNAGSRRVLEKIGMTHVSAWVEDGTGVIPGPEHGAVGYEMMRTEWATRTRRSAG